MKLLCCRLLRRQHQTDQTLLQLRPQQNNRRQLLHLQQLPRLLLPLQLLTHRCQLPLLLLQQQPTRSQKRLRPQRLNPLLLPPRLTHRLLPRRLTHRLLLRRLHHHWTRLLLPLQLNIQLLLRQLRLTVVRKNPLLRQRLILLLLTRLLQMLPRLLMQPLLMRHLPLQQLLKPRHLQLQQLLKPILPTLQMLSQLMMWRKFGLLVRPGGLSRPTPLLEINMFVKTFL